MESSPAPPRFRLPLPGGYRVADALAYHGRDPLSLSERVEGSRLLKALEVEGRAGLLEFAFGEGHVDVEGRGGLAGVPGPVLRVRAVRMLGMEADPAPFERAALAHAALAPLVAQRPGLRIPLTADAWESLVWAILGQQVNLAFAHTLRRRLTERCGGAPREGLRTHPGPGAVARLSPEDLKPLQFSRAKADYLLGAARQVADGSLPLEDLRGWEAERAAARLSSLRGVGPWTTHYVLMRGCGFPDCVPLGDAGLTLALQRAFGLDHRPGPRETASLMAPFAPHRSLATFHLWAGLSGAPA